MRIALSQLTTGPDPEKNLRLVEEWTRRAADAGALAVVFPEASMACFGTPLAPLAQPLDGPWADGVREIARSTGTVVVAGMFTPADEGRVANTLLATGPGVEESYDKIHLYDAFGFRESETVAPGSRPAVIDKLDQWELLVRARALDATVWVAAVGQADPGTGPGPVPTGIGHSLVVGPDGTVRASLGAEPELLVTDLDVEEVGAVREKTSVLANRRPQVWR
jgi:predicted amidohydrolase